ncbi:hypothetical protein XENORESO_014365, partial [Xenotaenia resolanae]
GGKEGCCPSQTIVGQEVGYTLDKSPVHHRGTRTLKCNLKRPINLTVMFSELGQARVPRKNPHILGENMQIQYRLEFKSRTFLLQGNNADNCTAMQPKRNMQEAYYWFFVVNSMKT